MKIKFLLMIAILGILVACIPQHPSEMPDIDFSADALNKEIRVFAVEGTVFRPNEDIWVSVDVIGSNQLIFPPDFGRRMFLYKNNQWAEVANIPTDYHGGDNILSPSHGDPFMWGDTWVYPLIPDLDNPHGCASSFLVTSSEMIRQRKRWLVAMWMCS